MLRLDQVAMRYGHGPEVLRDVSLTLRRGSFLFVTGPSGAGKTSLLRLLGLRHRPARGRMSIFGRDLADLRRHDLPPLRRRIGMVFQDCRLLDHLSTFDNVALPLRICGGHDEQIRSVVLEVLAWLGLADAAEADPATLSMGQRQLVAIARAVISRPNLLLCDEPTSNVDGRLAHRLMHLFAQLSRLGTTVVISTHNGILPERYPHPVLQIERGRLGRPAHPAALAAAD